MHARVLSAGCDVVIVVSPCGVSSCDLICAKRAIKPEKARRMQFEVGVHIVQKVIETKSRLSGSHVNWQWRLMRRQWPLCG